jgi:hypothetical protein
MSKKSITVLIYHHHKLLELHDILEAFVSFVIAVLFQKFHHFMLCYLLKSVIYVHLPPLLMALNSCTCYLSKVQHIRKMRHKSILFHKQMRQYFKFPPFYTGLIPGSSKFGFFQFESTDFEKGFFFRCSCGKFR